MAAHFFGVRKFGGRSLVEAFHLGIDALQSFRLLRRPCVDLGDDRANLFRVFRNQVERFRRFMGNDAAGFDLLNRL